MMIRTSGNLSVSSYSPESRGSVKAGPTVEPTHFLRMSGKNAGYLVFEVVEGELDRLHFHSRDIVVGLALCSGSAAGASF